MHLFVRRTLVQIVVVRRLASSKSLRHDTNPKGSHQTWRTVMKMYKLLGYLLLGIGVYAFINANNTDLQATAPVTQQQTPRKRSRHTISLVLSQLSELKVEEGERINDEAKLNYRRQQYEHSLKVSDYQTSNAEATRANHFATVSTR